MHLSIRKVLLEQLPKRNQPSEPTCPSPPLRQTTFRRQGSRASSGQECPPLAMPTISERSEENISGLSGGGRGLFIEIGDEQIDEHPFDPSLSDEEQLRRLCASIDAAARSPQEGRSITQKLARFMPSNRHRSPSERSSGSHNSASNSPRTSSPTSTPPLESLKSMISDVFGSIHNGSSDRHSVAETEEGTATSTNHATDDVEEAHVLSCYSHSATYRWNLVSLAQAKAIQEIVRRPEGFEMREARDRS